MGFYGNITNTSRSQFQFDKTYSSRSEMDSKAAADGVYIGRYVLVDYDTNLNWDAYPSVWIWDERENQTDAKIRVYGGAFSKSGEYYIQPVESSSLQNVSDKTLVYVPAGQRVYNIKFDDNKQIIGYNLNEVQELWKASVNNGVLSWSMVQTDNGDPFSTNYHLDYNEYGSSRGYDSTVWQKTSANGIFKYVMIAELNTVVPTFDITTDAPSLVPMVPHFDANSTNVYYKIHWQPHWGFRVRPANTSLTGPKIRKDGTIANEKIQLTEQVGTLPSDESVIWNNTFYNTQTKVLSKKQFNPNNGSWQTDNGTIPRVPAAIYYNKAGFDSTKTIYDKDTVDQISISPTGYSGNIYSDHAGNEVCEPDVQELSIMLPSIGNTISDVWDIIYGKNDQSRNKDIKWRNANDTNISKGLRLTTAGAANGQLLYEPNNVDTVAGCINSVHDIMGMIIYPLSNDEKTAGMLDQEEEQQKEDDIKYTPLNLGTLISYDDKLIYYIKQNGLYYRKKKGYKFLGENTNDLNNKYAFYYDTHPNTNISESDKNYPITNKKSDIINSLISSNENRELVYYDEKTLIDLSNSEYFYGANPVSPTKMDYILDKESFHKECNYYTIESTVISEDLSNTYKAGVFFHKDVITDKNGDIKTDYYSAIEIDPTSDKEYYKIDLNNLKPISSKNVEAFYVPGKYYYLDGSTYRLDTSEYGDIESKVYYITEGEPTKEDFTTEYIYTAHYIEQPSTSVNKDNYTNYYIYKDNKYVPAEEALNGVYDENQVYYKQSISTSSEKVLTAEHVGMHKYESGTLIGYIPNTYFIFETDDNNVKHFRSLTYNEIKDNQLDLSTIYSIYSNPKVQSYSYYDGSEPSNKIGSCYTWFIQAGKEYETIVDIQKIDKFYQRNTYYYKDENGSWLVDRNKNSTEKRKYYNIQATLEPDLIAYEKNKYYKLKNGKYVLSTDDHPTEDGVYYAKNNLYVFKDESGVYEKGTPWPSFVTKLPDGVFLTKRFEIPVLEELTGFANDIFTIHGALLKMAQVLELNDFETRDTSTVQGTINSLKDIIRRFDLLETNSLIAVNAYGQIESIKFGEDNWIEPSITTYYDDDDDGNKKYKDTIFNIAHKIISNDFNGQKSNNQNTTPAFGSTFNVPVITTDKAGHVTAFTTETVKIPGVSFTSDDADTTKDVVLNTNYTYDAATDIGTFTETRGKVDTLLIQDYALPNDNNNNNKLKASDSIHGAFEKLQAQINAMDLLTVAGGTGEYVASISAEDGKITATKGTLPTVEDTAVDGEFVNEVSETNGKISVSRTAFVPVVTLGEGTANNAPTVNISVNNKSATAQSLSKATTNIYGVTKLTSSYSSTSTDLAVNGTAVANALNSLKESLDASGVANIDASKTIKSWSETDGIVSVETQDILISNANIATNAAIAISKIDGLQDALDAKQPTIPNETYDEYGAASAVLGQDDDDENQLTIHGLLAKISLLEARITTLEGITPESEEEPTT